MHQNDGPVASIPVRATSNRVVWSLTIKSAICVAIARGDATRRQTAYYKYRFHVRSSKTASGEEKKEAQEINNAKELREPEHDEIE